MVESNYQDRLLKAIPGGAHTYSRGYDQYPANAPQILSRGKGAYIYTPNDEEFLDYGMALRAVNIGYAEEQIDLAAIKQISFGNNLTKPSMVELEAAELLVNIIDSAEMVKFTKNGSTAVTAAVKLARAFTGRDIVVRCQDHPFFSFDDWFISSTPITRGIPQLTINNTKSFVYNDINSLLKVIAENPGQIACLVMEPATSICPSTRAPGESCCENKVCEAKSKEIDGNFLQQVQKVCNENGIVFILDEMITGFRWHLKGAQHIYNITPDLSTFGKAMANGYSVSCIAGKREIMELGSIEKKGAERVFLLSTTHGAEMSSLGAFVETVNYITQHDTINHLWNYGADLVKEMNKLACKYEIGDYFQVLGPACSPIFQTLDINSKHSLSFRTLFVQEMVKSGVLMPWIALSHAHGDLEMLKTLEAVDKSLEIYKKALEDGFEKYLDGPEIQPVFRKYN
ncbi:HemL Glutamate-1-semialdehyde aminotransferase [Candidatus Nanopelagicaceae bacterium]